MPPRLAICGSQQALHRLDRYFSPAMRLRMVGGRQSVTYTPALKEGSGLLGDEFRSIIRAEFLRSSECSEVVKVFYLCGGFLLSNHIVETFIFQIARWLRILIRSQC